MAKRYKMENGGHFDNAQPLEIPILPFSYDAPTNFYKITDERITPFLTILKNLRMSIIRTFKAYDLIPKNAERLTKNEITIFQIRIKGRANIHFFQNKFTYLMDIQRMEDYLMYNGIENFLIFFDKKIFDVLTQIENLDVYSKNTLNISYKKFEELLKKIKEIKNISGEKTRRRTILTFLRKKSIQKILQQAHYPKNFYLFNINFHKEVLNLSKIKEESSKMQELKKILEKNENSVILVSNKNQHIIIQKWLEKHNFTNIFVGTPGEINKQKEKFENTEATLIYFDPELIERDSRINKRNIDLCFSKIIKLETSSN